jgi:hypothetical protein
MSANKITDSTEIKQNMEGKPCYRSKFSSRRFVGHINRPTDLDEVMFDWHINQPRELPKCVLLNEKTVENYRKNILLNKDLTVKHNANSTNPGKVGNWSDRIRKHYLCTCHGENPCPFTG